MTLDFSPEGLKFKGQINTKHGLDVHHMQLSSFGFYLDRGADLAKNFRLKMPFAHILSVLKVAEEVCSDFASAMECIENSAIVFLFTEAHNFQFTIGLANVDFENRDARVSSDSQAGEGKENLNETNFVHNRVGSIGIREENKVKKPRGKFEALAQRPNSRDVMNLKKTDSDGEQDGCEKITAETGEHN